MTNTELFIALFQGMLLEKDFAKTEPDRHRTDEIRIYILYIYYNPIENKIVLRGWGSQVYRPGDVLYEMATSPKNWSISTLRVTDKPWIPKQSSFDY